MITGSGTIEGTSAIRAHMAPYFSDTSATLTWAPRSAEASGALGYTIGRYEAKRRTGTGVTRETGTYVTIWRRGPDGDWLVALDIGNPDR
jgi:ketosteroid isomerase-like protein